MVTCIYREGAAAYWGYRSIVECPYKTPVEQGEWENGYCDARALDNMDIDYSEQHPASEESCK